MPVEETGPGSPHDLLRVSITLAAIAVALAALRADSPVAPFFLLAGFLASLGTGFAMMALWEDAGLGLSYLFTGFFLRDFDNRYLALVIITWALIVLYVVFVVFLFTSIY